MEFCRQFKRDRNTTAGIKELSLELRAFYHFKGQMNSWVSKANFQNLCDRGEKKKMRYSIISLMIPSG
jgi:hypothetical protein